MSEAGTTGPPAQGVRALPLSRCADTALMAASWLLLGVYVGVSVAITPDPWGTVFHGSDPQTSEALLAVLPVFFVVLVARLVLTARRDRGRAPALLVLAPGIACWAIGAGTITAAGPPAAVTYPAPGELWFLPGYLGMAAFLFLEGDNRMSAGAALDAMITFGGAFCVSGVLVSLPVAEAFGRQGMPLLVALMYPTWDLCLLLVLGGQLLVGTRSPSRGAGTLLAGLLTLGVGDAAMTWYLADGTYGKGLAVDVLWAAGFLLLVTGAVRGPATARPPARSGYRTSQVTLVAAAAAVCALAIQPTWLGNTFLLMVPALVTLAAVGVRLAMALNAAHGAAEAHRLSLTDDLTGIPNRRALLRHLTERLADSSPTSLLLLDLDGFKDINDTLGHAAGDAVLRLMAARLAGSPTGATMTARLGGDEFALVFSDTDADLAIRTAHAVRALIHKAADVDGIELGVDCSVGVAVAGTGAAGAIADHRELLRRADVAMYLAKAGSEGAGVYDPARDEFTRQRLRLTQELAHAIDDGQIHVWYQPQVDAVTGAVVSVEALARWVHPQRGLILPAEFLPVARRAGLMASLTETVIRTAVRDAAAWHAAGCPVGLSINIAPAELLSTTVMSALTTHVQEVGLPPERVVVEVTEDSFLAQPDRALEVILGLRRSGLQVAVDDYGTGFSSLAYLKSLPVQELKIDKSFVRDILVDPRARVIVETTIGLARGLGMRLVAEGVEDEGVAGALTELGLDLLQGYHFGPPVPGSEVITRLLAGAGSTRRAGRERTPAQGPLPVQMAPDGANRNGEDSSW